MEYTKESLKGWGKSIAGLGGDMDGHLLNYAAAWAQEVAELKSRIEKDQDFIEELNKEIENLKWIIDNR